MQRWISDGEGLGSEEGARQLQRFINKTRQQGWRPRLVETVPADIRDDFLTAKTGNGEEVYRVGPLVLCEMEVALAHERFAAINDINKRQASTLPDSTEQARGKYRGTDADLKIEQGDDVYQGRPAPTMVD